MIYPTFHIFLSYQQIPHNLSFQQYIVHTYDNDWNLWRFNSFCCLRKGLWKNSLFVWLLFYLSVISTFCQALKSCERVGKWIYCLSQRHRYVLKHLNLEFQHNSIDYSVPYWEACVSSNTMLYTHKDINYNSNTGGTNGFISFYLQSWETQIIKAYANHTMLTPPPNVWCIL